MLFWHKTFCNWCWCCVGDGVGVGVGVGAGAGVGVGVGVGVVGGFVVVASAVLYYYF